MPKNKPKNCSDTAWAVYKSAMLIARQPNVNSFADVARIMLDKLPPNSLTFEDIAKAIHQATAGTSKTVNELTKKVNSIMAEGIATDKIAEKMKEYRQKARAMENLKYDKPEAPMTPKEKKEAKAELKELKKLVEAADDDVKLSKLAKETYKAYLASGITDRAAALAATYNELTEVFPHLTFKDVRRLLDDYGQFTPYMADPVTALWHEHRRLFQLDDQLEDWLANKQAERTGRENPPRTESIRKKEKEVNKAKRDADVDEAMEKRLKSWLESRKTRLENVLADLQEAIDTNKQIEKRKFGKKKDARLIELEKMYRETKKLYDDTFETGNSDAAKARKLLENAKKRTAELQRKISENDFSRTVHKSPPITQEISDIRKKNKELARELLSKDPNRPNIVALRNRIAELQTWLNGGERPGAKVRNLDNSPEAVELRLVVKELKDELAASDDERLRMYGEQIAALEQRLRDNQFAPKVPESIYDLDGNPEILKKQTRIAELQAQIRRKQLALKPKTKTERVIDWANGMRAMQAGMDLSALLSQGSAVVFTHPMMSASRIKPMFDALVSKDAYNTILKQIKENPNYPLYQAAGLYLSFPEMEFTQREELFATDAFERFWMAASERAGKYVGKPAELLKLPVGSQDAYIAFLNLVRISYFDMMVEELGTTQLHEMQAIAEFINVATGRSSFGFLEAHSPLFNMLFFAPRFALSRFSMVAGYPIWKYGLGKKTLPDGRVLDYRKVQRYMFKEWAKMIRGYALFYGLVWMMFGLKEGEDDDGLVMQPKSTDFGKLVLGRTRLDPLGGMAQAATFYARFFGGERISSLGEAIPMRGPDVPYGGQDIEGMLGKQLRYKLAPAPALALTLFSGRDAIGKPVDGISGRAKEVLSSFTPLGWRDFLAVHEEHGVPAGTAMFALALFGMRLNVYEERD